MLSKENQEKVAIMLAQIKSMEGLLGRDRTKNFTRKTLRAQVKKGSITEDQCEDLLKQLGYD